MSNGRFAKQQVELTRDQLHATWQLSLPKLIDFHNARLKNIESYPVSEALNFQFDPEGGFFTLQMLDASKGRPPMRTVKVKLDLTTDTARAQCLCERHAKFRCCEHTYDAALFLLENLEDQKSAVSRSIKLPEFDWKAALAKMDFFLSEADEVELDEPNLRLAWRIEPFVSELRLHPYEQKRNAKGTGWTKGRSIPLDRVRDTPEIWSLPVDEKLAECIGESQDAYSFYSRYYSDRAASLKLDVFRALPFLAGHPLVTWADENGGGPTIEIKHGQLGLEWHALENGMQLRVTIDGNHILDTRNTFAFAGKGVAVVDRPGNLILFAEADASTLRFIDYMNSTSPVLPPEAQDEVLKRIPQFEKKLPVHLPDNMLAGAEPADERLYLRLTPTNADGLNAELMVRPAPEGSYFYPGQGPERLNAFKDEQRIRVQRDLAGEITRARAMQAELPLGNSLSMGEWRYYLPTIDQTLELLQKVSALPEETCVVEWPDGEKTEMSFVGEITADSLSLEIKKERDWFGLKGTIHLAGQEFPLIELLNALQGNPRFLKLSDGRWAAISAELRERLTILDDVLHRNRKRLQFNDTAAPVIADLADQNITIQSSKAWTESLRRMEAAVKLNPHPPVSFAAELRDYQLEGYRWLSRLAAWGVGGCLADDMGLGKTIQALAVLVDRMEHGPALVIAPTSVGFNWAREAERFAPTLTPTLYRDTDRSEFLDSVGAGDVVITSYALALRHAEELSNVEWGTLIIDEAQFIKNSSTKTARAIRDLPAKWKLALTGTPLENHLGDLWSLFRSVSPGLLGSWDRFRNRFVTPIQKQNDSESRKRLSRTIRPFILRRTKSEVLSELPQRTEIELTAELSKAERKLYEDARLWAAAHLANLAQDQEEIHFQVLSALTRLRQLACHPRLVDPDWEGTSAKLDLLLDTVDELREGRHRALVFSQFVQHLALIREALDERKISYQYLDGSTPAHQRQERVEAFQRGEGDLFLISLKAGGTGLNLTAADYVIHMDPWWNPAVEDQATDRAHRIGQTRPVTVYRLVTADTIEQQILDLHREKRTLVADILAGSDQAGRLNTAELLDLIREGVQPEHAS